MNNIILMIALLFTKHFIIDFPLQTKYQWSNKGIYGHPGGILHAGLHGIGTFFTLLTFGTVGLVAFVATLDTIIHYHIDWLKININKQFGWSANTSEKFWWLLGFDQYLHAMTYIGLIYFLLNHNGQ